MIGITNQIKFSRSLRC